MALDTDTAGESDVAAAPSSGAAPVVTSPPPPAPAAAPGSPLSVSAFSAAIKAKYPEYKDIDDARLAKAIVAKYPEYASKVTFDAPPAAPPPAAPPPAAPRPPPPAPAFKSANPFGAVAAASTAITPDPAEAVPRQKFSPQAQAQAEGEEFLNEQQNRADAVAKAQAAAAAHGYGSDFQRYAQDKGIALKPLISTPAELAEEKSVAAGGAAREVSWPFTHKEIPAAVGRPLVHIGDMLQSLANSSTVMLSGWIQGKPPAEMLGTQEEQASQNLQTQQILESAKTKEDQGVPLEPEERRAIDASKFTAQIKAAGHAIKADPLGAGKDMLFGALENAPTYILASVVGGEVVEAAKGLITTGEDFARMSAIATKAAPEATTDPEAIEAAKAALVKPSLASTVGHEVAANTIGMPVAGEVQKAQQGGKYDASQLAQDLVAGGVLSAGGSLFKSLMDARPLSAADFSDLQKAVDVAGIQDHPAIKELLPSLLETARNPEFTGAGGRISLDPNKKFISEDEARAAYGDDAIPPGTGPVEATGATVTPATEPGLAASPPTVKLFGGADASTVKEEVTHFMQQIVQRRAAQGDAAFQDLQDRINNWETAVRQQVTHMNEGKAPSEMVRLPKGDELFGQAYTSNRGYPSPDPDVARVAVPEPILSDFDKLFGGYKKVGAAAEPVRDIDGKGVAKPIEAAANPIANLPAVEPPATPPALEGLPSRTPEFERTLDQYRALRGNPLLENAAERQRAADAAEKEANPNPGTTPVSLLSPNAARAVTDARVKSVVEHANAIQAAPTAEALLPPHLQGLTDAQKRMPATRIQIEAVRQANLEQARKMKENPKDYEVRNGGSGSTVGSYSQADVPGKFGPKEEPAAPVKSASDRFQERMEQRGGEERMNEPDFKVGSGGEAIPNPNRLPPLHKEPIEPHAGEVPKVTEDANEGIPKTTEGGSTAVQPDATEPQAESSESEPVPKSLPLRDMMDLIKSGDIVKPTGRPPYATTEKGARALYHGSYFDEKGEHEVDYDESSATPRTDPSQQLGGAAKTKEKGSALYQIRREQTDTPEFKKWFGDSKVVDEDGDPVVVYHGTGKNFDSFDVGRAGSGSGTPQEKAIFLTTDKNEASDRAEIAGVGDESDHRGAVMPVYVKAENPYTSDLTTYNSKRFSEEIAKAKSLGHDSIFFPKVDYKGEKGTVAVFSPEQIKSSIGNFGSFDPRDPRILYQIRRPYRSPGPQPELARGEPEEEEPTYAPPEDRVSNDLPDTPRRPGESQEQWRTRVAGDNATAIKAATNLSKTMRIISRGGQRAMLATRDRLLGTADRAFKTFSKKFDRRGEDANLAAYDAYERRLPIKDPVYKAFFDAAGAALDERWKQVVAISPESAHRFIENYLPHLWKDPVKAAEWYQRQRGPLEGNKDFLKQRFHDTLKSGMDSGLEPVSTNPVDLVLAKLEQMDKFITMNKLRAEWDAKGWVKPIGADGYIPPGFSRVNDPSFNNKMVPDVVAKDLNNYLSPGLYRYKAWRSFRKAENFMLMARLGASAFHAGFTTIDTAVSHLDLALRQAIDMNFVGAAKALGKGLISPVTSPIEGAKLLKRWYGQEAADPQTAAVLNALTEGGSRAHMDPTDYSDDFAKWIKAWRVPKDYSGRVKYAVLGSVEATSRLITHHLVPMQKMASRVMLAKFELDRLAKDLGKEKGDYAGITDAMRPDVLRQIMGKVTQQVDDRLGQIAYDNLFMPRLVKDIAQASIQAVGWNIGTFNTIFGGIADARRLFTPEKYVASLDKAGNLPIGDMSRVTGRLSYLIAMNVGIGLLGATTQMMLTGKPPSQLKDFFFPRTGRINPDGSEERISFPGYMKDEFQVIQHPLTTGIHKLHPMFSTVAELIQNKDFYGTQIQDTDSPWYQRAGDVTNYLFHQFEPYAFQGMERARQAGKSPLEMALPFVGIMPAPSSITGTPFMDYMAEKSAAGRAEGGETKERAVKAQNMHEAEAAIRRGETPDLSQLSHKDRHTVEKVSHIAAATARFKRLSIEEKIRAYQLATPEEREKYKLHAALMRGRDRDMRDVSPADRPAIQAKLAAISAESRQAADSAVSAAAAQADNAAQ